MGLFSSILGAVAGPIAGLFGSKKSKPQVVENRVDYQRMVRDAEAAGFNPLTALRNGGSAGFSSQISHPALSSGSFSSGIGDALANGVSAWASYDPMADQKADLEYQLVQEQLKTVQQMNRQERRSFDVPTYSGANTRSSSGGFRPNVPVAGVNPGGSLKVTDPWSGSVFDPYMTIHPGLPDAETQSTRYGEIVEMIGGVGVLGGDLAYSAYKRPTVGPNVDKAMKEVDDLFVGTKPLRDAGSNAFAKASIPKRGKEFYPDMQDFLRARGPAW